MADPLFNFTLRPLDQVEPWGEPPHRSLSWFALTDGHYWLRFGGQTLYEYTPEILRHWNSDPLQPGYVDYQVSRLHEDLLEILPNVLEPVPEDIAGRADELHALESVNYSIEDNYSALRWLGCRCLSAMHLAAGPHVYFVSTGEYVRIFWDNRRLIIDGIPVWTSQRGDLTLPLDTLVDEVRDFHERLMSQMHERTLLAPEVCARRSISLDVDALRREQLERSVFQISPDAEEFPGWDKIRQWTGRLLNR